MNTVVRKMPIGIQSFEDLRRQQYVYVDKTALVYRLASMRKPYFLSRPVALARACCYLRLVFITGVSFSAADRNLDCWIINEQ